MRQRLAGRGHRVRGGWTPVLIGGAASIGLSLTAILLSAATVYAGCFGPNLGAGAGLTTHPDARGLRGGVDLMSGQPVAGASIAHPAQLVNTDGLNFVAIGTYKGAGTSGGIVNCPAVTGTRWAIYVDGRMDGIYFCKSGYGSQPDVAANQNFEIRHTTCPSGPWAGEVVHVFWWNTVFKTCHEINKITGFPAVGGESVGYNPQSIDVHFEQLQYRILGGSWTNWSTVPAGSRCEDSPPYDLTTSNGTTDWSALE
jgi:hypothetical protein